MKFVLLAAGKGSRIYKKINKPKCLLQINGTSLIEKIIKDIKSISKEKIHIVVGFKSNLIKKNLKKYQRLHFIDNKDYKKKEMLHSLILALQGINDDIIFSYTDIIYNKTVIKNLLHQKKNIHLPILKNWKRVWKKRKDMNMQAIQCMMIYVKFVVSPKELPGIQGAPTMNWLV